MTSTLESGDSANYGVEALAARARINDLIALYANCIDRRRWDLLSEVFHEDAVWWASSIGLNNWRETAQKSAEQFAASLDVTLHHIGQVLISIDGDQAHSEAYCWAYHRVRADAPLGGMFGGIGSAYDLIAGGRYIDRWERRDGVWKIAERRTRSEWRHMQSAADGVLPAHPTEARGRFDDLDGSTPVVARFRAAVHR